MRSDDDRLLDILDAIKAIQEQAPSRDTFDADKLVRVWCLHHLVIVGEAASRVSDARREQHQAVPWRRVIAMRNAVVHGYFSVDWDEVWTVVENDIDPLRIELERILAAQMRAV